MHAFTRSTPALLPLLRSYHAVPSFTVRRLLAEAWEVRDPQLPRLARRYAIAQRFTCACLPIPRRAQLIAQLSDVDLTGGKKAAKARRARRDGVRSGVRSGASRRTSPSRSPRNGASATQRGRDGHTDEFLARDTADASKLRIVLVRVRAVGQLRSVRARFSQLHAQTTMCKEVESENKRLRAAFGRLRSDLESMTAKYRAAAGKVAVLPSVSAWHACWSCVLGWHVAHTWHVVWLQYRLQIIKERSRCKALAEQLARQNEDGADLRARVQDLTRQEKEVRQRVAGRSVE